MNGDPGYFGPDSMMWQVNKEITVLFGGARALLMHAAHPLIAAGARQTSFYQRDPWKRLIRTLSLQNSVTFGTIEEADESATRINRLHEVIKGKDEITGDIYDALDHEQLLWVHACLQLSSIYFYEQTVKKLTQEQKDKYHKENMLSAKLVLIDTKKMPKTHNELKNWVIKKSKTKDYLLMTDVAKDVGDIISGGPVLNILNLYGLLYRLLLSTLYLTNSKIYMGSNRQRLNPLFLNLI